MGNLESTMAATIEVPPPAPNIHSFQFLCNPSIQSLRYQTSSLLQKRVVGTMIFAVADATQGWSCVMLYVVSRYTYKIHQESSHEYTPVNSFHQRL